MTTRKTEAANRRAHAQHRANLLAALGMAPEASSRYEDRYAATTGELITWCREKGLSVAE